MFYPTEEVPEDRNGQKNDVSTGDQEGASSPEVVELQKRYGDLNDRFLRLAADFDNFKRRTARDIDAQARSAVERLVVELLEVMDNFDRAAKQEEISSSREGMDQIRKLFTAILERHGIRQIEAVGKKFNPVEHEAVLTMPSPEEEGVVIEEVCRGYCLDQKVIRCAKVVVSSGKECD
jgi:molecular chaperone GrpE